MKQGYLWYNEQTRRYGIVDGMDCWDPDGLSCGTCFDAYIGGKWVPVRLEHSDYKYPQNRGWYLFDDDGAELPAPQQVLDGLRVRL